MKPTIRKLGAVRGQPAKPGVFAPPSPKVTRRKPAKVLTTAERAAFLEARPDLKTRK